MNRIVLINWYRKEVRKEKKGKASCKWCGVKKVALGCFLSQNLDVSDIILKKHTRLDYKYLIYMLFVNKGSHKKEYQ